MKRWMIAVLVLCLLPVCALPEEEDLILEEIVEDVIIDEDGNELLYDEATGETFLLTQAEQDRLNSMEPEEEDLDEDVELGELEINTNLPSNVVNILLVGVDTRSNDPQNITGLGDTEIIVSVNKETGEIKMTSILRDSYVAMVPARDKAKINEAFQRGCRNGGGTAGGASRAMRVINHNFDMNLQYCVAINFNGLASIIDSLGGIDIALTEAEANYINYYLKEHPPAYDNKAKGERVRLDWKSEKAAGAQEVVDGRLILHLDGVQAVMYARIRKLDNDFSRTDRQRHLLDLLLQLVVQDMSVDKLLDLLDACMPYAWTNMNISEIFDLCVAVMRSDILSRMNTGSLFDQMRLPLDNDEGKNNNWHYATSSSGASVIEYRHMSTHIQALHEFIYGAYYPAD